MICTLYCWVLRQAALSTIFWVFSMTQPGIETRSPEPLANTLLIRSIVRYFIKSLFSSNPKISGFHHSSENIIQSKRILFSIIYNQTLQFKNLKPKIKLRLFNNQKIIGISLSIYKAAYSVRYLSLPPTRHDLTQCQKPEGWLKWG